MASTIYFNGRVTAVPGSYSEVDATGLGRPALGASGIVACIGEAEGGAPYTVTGDGGIHRVSNPGKVPRIFRQGDLLEAGDFLFNPSADADIPGGAQEVVFVKVNPATPSSKTVRNGANTSNTHTFTTVEYGLFTKQTAIEIADGTEGGKEITIYADYDGQTETFDNVGAAPWFGIAWPGIANIIGSDFENMLSAEASLDPASGFKVEAAVQLPPASMFSTANVPTPSTRTLKFDGMAGSLTNPFSGPDTIRLVSSNAGDTAVSLTIYGVDNATGLPASETVTLNGTTPVTTTKTWLRFHGFTKQTTVGTVTVSMTTGPTTLIAAAPGLNAAGAGLRAISGDLLTDNGKVWLRSTAGVTSKVLIVGYNAAEAATLEEVTLNATTWVASSTSWRNVAWIFAVNVASDKTVDAGASWWSYGPVNVVSSDAADTFDVVVVGRDADGAWQSEVIALNGTTAVPTAFSYRSVVAVAATLGDNVTPVMQNLTVYSNDDVVDQNGHADADYRVYAKGGPLNVSDFESLPVVLPAGLGSTPAISHDFTGFTGDGVVLFGYDGNGALRVESYNLPGTPGTEADFSALLGVAILRGYTGTGVATPTLSWDAVAASVEDFATLSALARLFQGTDLLTLNVVNPKGSKVGLSSMDLAAAQSLVVADPEGVPFYGVWYDVIDVVNANSGYVTVAGATASATQEPPGNRAKTFLTGGSEGTTAFADWQAALNKLKGYRVNTIVALTDDEAVHAAVLSHCAWAAGPGRSERDAILGAPTNQTLAALQGQVRNLNTRHVRYAHQDVVRFNTDGEREQFPPYFTACLAAGMQGASPVGTSLTHKYARVLDVIGRDSSYTVVDDADTLIQSGLLTLERVPNIGWRWLRNVTTYLTDSNPAYTEGHVNAGVNYAIYEFRRAMEWAVGQKAFDGTIGTAVSIATAILGQLAGSDINVISSWRNLTITIDGDVMTVDVEVAPVESVNFVKNTMHLVRGTFAAAA